MTEPRDPTEPTIDPPTDADPSATARMPLPADPPEPAAPPATAWTAPTTPPPASPAWRPTRTDDGRGPSMIFGLILLAVGLWFFGEQTLGLDLPTLRWSQLWPLILIVAGVWVLLGARRRAR